MNGWFKEQALSLRERPLKEVGQVASAPVTPFQPHPTSGSIKLPP